jgi:hypothetical protein
MDVPESIVAFQQAIQEAKTVEDVTSWWDWCEKIEASIATDLRATTKEKQLVASLKDAVSIAIMLIRDHGRDPDRGRISAILFGLQSSIERRTIGADGWPRS